MKSSIQLAIFNLFFVLMNVFWSVWYVWHIVHSPDEIFYYISLGMSLFLVLCNAVLSGICFHRCLLIRNGVIEDDEKM